MNPGSHPPLTDPKVTISLKRFLLIEQCPETWRSLDLYLFRDDAVVFYVGQSHLAFARVWQHLLDGFKGRSLVGRFVWSNWPTSMRFTLELLSSQSAQFHAIGHDVTAVEQGLIAQWSPCLNVTHNRQPTPIPPAYRLPNASLRCGRSLKKLIREAERAVRMEDNQPG